MIYVRTGYENERWFHVTTGVKQGSVLSPLLFIAYMDTVIRKFRERINIPGHVMIFADDVVNINYLLKVRGCSVYIKLFFRSLKSFKFIGPKIE